MNQEILTQLESTVCNNRGEIETILQLSNWAKLCYLEATFTFNMASNATPCEKLSEELQFDTNIYYRFTANVEVFRCRKAIPERHLSPYLASPRESQIETLWSDRD